MTNATTTPASAPPVWAERLWAAAAYLCWLTPPLGMLTRFLVYSSKGKTSRFVGLHAVQAMLLGLAILFVQVPLGFLALFLSTPTRRDALGMAPAWTVVAVACAMPLGSGLWMALSVLFGRLASAPIFGRWAREITDPDLREGGATDGSTAPADAAAGPMDRLLAGAAYVSMVPFFILGPLVLYAWKRRSSRFVAVHAVQALLMEFVLLAGGYAVGRLGKLLVYQMYDRGVPLSPWVHGVACASDCATLMLPWAAAAWRGIRVMRGGAGDLPVLGRLAKAILGTSGTRATVEGRLVPTLRAAMNPGAVIAGLPYGDRVLASASYLSAFGGFWLVVPAFVFLWKGRRSPFLGFHALQAVFLQVAMIPIMGVGIGLAYALSSLLLVVGSEKLVPLAGFLLFAIGGIAITIPTAATVWMSTCALRGQPRELPLLGRWARTVIRDV